MDKPVEFYWQKRLESVADSLRSNNFEVHLAEDKDNAKEIVLSTILPAIHPKSVSWGGSKTFVSTGLYHALKDRTDFTVLDTFDKNIDKDEIHERRRQSLLVDLFFSGTNALTEDGTLVNLDMYGNRACALAFGPKHVVVLVGRNKIVHDLEDAWFRIKNFAAPTNAMRLDKKTPCVTTSRCEDCKSADRICNVWTIIEKSLPKSRIKIVLINQDLGF